MGYLSQLTSRKFLLVGIVSIIVFVVLLNGIVSLIGLSSPHGTTVSSFSPCEQSAGSPVAVSLSGELPQSVPGATLGVVASLHNAGTDALRDGVLFVRVYKDAHDGDSARIIDEYPVMQGVDISAYGTTTYNFAWTIPYDASASTYHLEGFVASPSYPFISAPSNKPIDSASTYSIDLKSAAANTVYIDTASVKVGNSEYSAADTLAQFTPGEPLLVSLRVINPTDIPYEGTLTSNAYATAASPLGTPLASVANDVRVHPHSSTTIAYMLPPLMHSSYYLQSRLRRGDATQGLEGITLVQKGLCTHELVAKVSKEVLEIAILTMILVIVVGGGLILKRRRNRK